METTKISPETVPPSLSEGGGGERGLNEYNVHIYAVVRIKACGVKATSYEEAITKANDQVDINTLLRRENPGHGASEMESAEEMDGYLVDVVGDTEFRLSKHFKADGKTEEDWK